MAQENREYAAGYQASFKKYSIRTGRCDIVGVRQIGGATGLHCNKMKTWVWKGQPLQLRIVVLGIAVSLAALAIFELATWLTRPKFFGLVLFACLQLALAFGMVRMLPWARVLAALGLWLSLVVVVVLMIGIINPFTAMDIQASGRELPSGTVLLALFAVPIAVILWFIHVLGKYKRHFGHAAATKDPQASPEGSEPPSVH